MRCWESSKRNSLNIANNRYRLNCAAGIVMNTQLKPIKSENDYAEALELMNQIFSAEEVTPEADVRDVLSE